MCPESLSEEEKCNTQNCPVNCTVSPWSSFGNCNAPCGGGSQTKSRTITKGSQFGGVCPESLSEEEKCNTQNCPINCTVSPWSSWSKCPVSCGGGSQTKTRTITKGAQFGGVCPESLSEEEKCNTQNCPVNCTVSPWSSFGNCNAPCGGGSQTKSRTITKGAQFGGVCPESLSEEEKCNTQNCPVNCTVSPWSSWSKCPVLCGGGTQTKTRTITKGAQFGGVCPEFLSEEEKCNTQNCPINCTVSPWSSFGNCNAPCGGGTQTKSRTITKGAQFGGVCPESLSEEEKCNTQNCPINCTVSPWSSFGNCNAPCGGGTQTKSRTITKGAQFGGVCPESLSEEEKCNTQNCPINCTVSPWSSFGNCNAPCGGGTQTKSRTITKNAQNGGICPESSFLSEEETCNMQPCAINCTTNPWLPWSNCSSECGEGLHMRIRTANSPQNGGTQCTQPLQEEESCNTLPCVPYTYMGCYADSPNRAVPTQLSDNTVTGCYNAALSANDTYFAMQAPGSSTAQCFVGGTNTNYATSGTSNACTQKDGSGNPLGNYWVNAVYKINKTPSILLTGDRRSYITVSGTVTSVSDFTKFVNGNVNNGVYSPGTSNLLGKYFQFQFIMPIILQGIKLWVQTSSTWPNQLSYWSISGVTSSNSVIPIATYIPITLSTSNAYVTWSFINVTAYTTYQLSMTSGTIYANPWVNEFDFSLIPYLTTMSFLIGDRRQIMTVTGTVTSVKDFTVLINGNLTDASWSPATTDLVGKYIQFNFPTPIILQGIKLWAQTNSSWPNQTSYWSISGVSSPTTTTPITTQNIPITFTTSSGFIIWSFPNTTAYTTYQLSMVSGTIYANPWFYEFDFSYVIYPDLDYDMSILPSGTITTLNNIGANQSNNFAMTSNGSVTITSNSINGKSSGTITNNNNGLRTANLSSLNISVTNVTIALVFKYNKGDSNNPDFIFTGNDSSFIYDNSTRIINYQASLAINNSVLTGITQPCPWAVCVIKFNGSTSAYCCNSSNIVTFNENTGGITGNIIKYLCLGFTGDGSLSCLVGECQLYFSALSNYNMITVYNSLQAKWGIIPLSTIYLAPSIPIITSVGGINLPSGGGGPDTATTTYVYYSISLSSIVGHSVYQITVNVGSSGKLFIPILLEDLGNLNFALRCIGPSITFASTGINVFTWNTTSGSSIINNSNYYLGWYDGGNGGSILFNGSYNTNSNNMYALPGNAGTKLPTVGSTITFGNNLGTRNYLIQITEVI